MDEKPQTSLQIRIALGAFFGLAGVLLGAFGAHALDVRLAEAGMTQVWETAVNYLQLHAVAIIAVALWGGWDGHPKSVRAGARIGLLWAVGIVLFSGSLFWLALGGPRWLGPVTPVGGLAMAGGWLWLALAALGRSRG